MSSADDRPTVRIPAREQARIAPNPVDVHKLERDHYVREIRLRDRKIARLEAELAESRGGAR